MVRPIGNAKFVCTQCDWSQRNHYESDVIHDKPQVCPECGNENFSFKIEEDKSLFTKLRKWLMNA